MLAHGELLHRCRGWGGISAECGDMETARVCLQKKPQRIFLRVFFDFNGTGLDQTSLRMCGLCSEREQWLQRGFFSVVFQLDLN